MKNAKVRILECIIHSRDEYPTLGRLNAEHIDDLSRIMEKFAEDTVVDVLNRVNKGERVVMSGCIVELPKSPTK